MKYVWHYDVENEIGRYLFDASYIAKEFSGKYFYVLPYLPKNKYKMSTVYLPRLKNKLSAIQWEYIRENSFDVPTFDMKFPGRLALKKEIEELGLLSNKEVSNIKKKWEGFTPSFEKVLKEIHTAEQIDVSSIHIYPIQYGTYGSYYYSPEKNEIYIYIRSDVDAACIAAMITVGLIRKNTIPSRGTMSDAEDVKSGTYEYVTAIQKYIFSGTRFASLIEDTDYQYASLGREGNATLARESIKYLTELGFNNNNILKITDKGILNSKTGETLANLSPQEESVLKLLLKNAGSVCTYEDIAEILWGEEYAEKFSLYSINKVMHQVRSKLRIYGFHGMRIHTRRGQGYLLYY